MHFFSIRRSRSELIWLHRVMLWTALIGLFVSSYLLIVYAGNLPIVCGLSHGCDQVRASIYSKMFGLPRPLFGVLYYGFFISILAFRIYAHRVRAELLYLLALASALIGFVESMYLVWLQAAVIQAFCLWCLTSSAATTVLFVLSLFDAEENLSDEQAFTELKVFLLSAVGAFFISIPALYLLLRS